MTREEMTTVLELTTNYSFEYLQSLSLVDLEKLFKEKVQG